MANKRISASSPDFNTSSPLAHVDSALGHGVYAADGAIAEKEGTIVITKGSACALTLAAPTAGAPASGGDDGKVLRVSSTTAFAHTVTCPANKINGNKAVSTFGAAVANFQVFVAYSGIWYAQEQVGSTLS